MEPARYPHLTHLTLSSSGEHCSLLSLPVLYSKQERIFNIALTVKDTSTGTGEMTTLKNSSNVVYLVNSKLMY